MEINYIVQPNLSFGKVVDNCLFSAPFPLKVIIASAFAKSTTVKRLRDKIKTIKDSGTKVRIILGIDLRGTSLEALQEVCSWNVDAKIFYNPRPIHTFHPKIYLFEREHTADVLIGSNNLTDGGFFTNYEFATHLRYNFPTDLAEYKRFQKEAETIINPSGTIVQTLTKDLIELLAKRNEIATEKEIRQDTSKKYIGKKSAQKPQSPFKGITVALSPPLPKEILSEMSSYVAKERKKVNAKEKQKKIALNPLIQLTPFSFYMELNKLQGPNIPGEARIPIDARDMAEDFWGWQGEYVRESRSKGNSTRWYWNYKPAWKIIDLESPEMVHHENVRMYFYEASSDFRFYSHKLVELGGNEGDIIRISKINEDEAVYECCLAKHNSSEYEKWIVYCTNDIRNSTRKYGYA